MARGGPGKRGLWPAPQASRLPDAALRRTARVNLGRVAGEKGRLERPYITNMGERIVEDRRHDVRSRSIRRRSDRGRGAPARPASTRLGGGEGTAGGGRGGAKSEPQVPFQPWAAADLRLQLEERVEIRSRKATACRPAVRA